MDTSSLSPTRPDVLADDEPYTRTVLFALDGGKIRTFMLSSEPQTRSVEYSRVGLAGFRTPVARVRWSMSHRRCSRWRFRSPQDRTSRMVKRTGRSMSVGLSKRPRSRGNNTEYCPPPTPEGTQMANEAKVALCPFQ